MSYCRTHGRYDDSEYGCPSCQRVEESNQERLDEIAERLEQ